MNERINREHISKLLSLNNDHFINQVIDILSNHGEVGIRIKNTEKGERIEIYEKIVKIKSKYDYS